MRTKKSLGQHFLKSEKALNSIVQAGEVEAEDVVLEIGPGRGALTEKLLTSGCQLIAVEKDDELYEFLKEKFEKEIKNKKLNLIHGDILDFDISYYLLSTADYKLIANIPYNITGAVFRKFLSAERIPERMVLLVQKEVAERIVARDNKESLLSISVKAYGTPRLIERVLAGSFVPAPKVDSTILLVERISKDFFVNFSEREFFALLRAAFASKRKKLSSNLGSLFSKEKILETFQLLGLDQNTRAEDVSLELWQKLASNLYKPL